MSVAVAKDGNVWATGSAVAGVGCTIPPVPPPGPVDGQHDALLVRLSPAGDTLSVQTFGNLRDDNGFAVAASPDGSMYLGGTGTGEIVFDPGPPSVHRFLAGGDFVLKLSASGGLIWVRVLNGPNLSSIAATSDGGVLAAGLGEGRRPIRDPIHGRRWVGLDVRGWQDVRGPQHGGRRALDQLGRQRLHRRGYK